MKIFNFLFPSAEFQEKEVLFQKVEDKQLISEFRHLRDGGKFMEPEFITRETQKELLENTFSLSNIYRVGLENTKALNTKIENKCRLYDNHFSLDLVSHPSEVIFYIRQDEKLKDWLKGLKLKVEPLSKAISKNKKALLGFLKSENYQEGLFNIYKYVISNTEKEIGFEKIVFVLMVDESTEYIQSPQFQHKKMNMKDFCTKQFRGMNVVILIKNKKNESDIEIKRNLKNLLGQYKIEDIELMDENINDSIRDWVFSINNKYFIDLGSPKDEYHVLLNL